LKDNIIEWVSLQGLSYMSVSKLPLCQVSNWNWYLVLYVSKGYRSEYFGYFRCFQSAVQVASRAKHVQHAFSINRTSKTFQFPFYSLKAHFFLCQMKFFYFLGIFTRVACGRWRGRGQFVRWSYHRNRSQSSFHRTGTHLCQMLNTIVQYLFNVNEKRSPSHMSPGGGAECRAYPLVQQDLS